MRYLSVWIVLPVLVVLFIAMQVRDDATRMQVHDNATRMGVSELGNFNTRLYTLVLTLYCTFTILCMQECFDPCPFTGQMIFT